MVLQGIDTTSFGYRWPLLGEEETLTAAAPYTMMWEAAWEASGWLSTGRRPG